MDSAIMKTSISFTGRSMDSAIMKTSISFSISISICLPFVVLFDASKATNSKSSSMSSKSMTSNSMSYNSSSTNSMTNSMTNHIGMRLNSNLLLSALLVYNILALLLGDGVHNSVGHSVTLLFSGTLFLRDNSTLLLRHILGDSIALRYSSGGTLLLRHILDNSVAFRDSLSVALLFRLCHIVCCSLSPTDWLIDGRANFFGNNIICSVAFGAGVGCHSSIAKTIASVSFSVSIRISHDGCRHQANNKQKLFHDWKIIFADIMQLFSSPRHCCCELEE